MLTFYFMWKKGAIVFIVIGLKKKNPFDNLCEIFREEKSKDLQKKKKWQRITWYLIHEEKIYFSAIIMANSIFSKIQIGKSADAKDIIILSTG